MEVDLDNETRRAAENQKNYKKQERRLKDVLQQQEEDQKNLQHFKDQIDRLNKKIKSTKTNQEEAVRYQFPLFHRHPPLSIFRAELEGRSRRSSVFSSSCLTFLTHFLGRKNKSLSRKNPMFSQGSRIADYCGLVTKMSLNVISSKIRQLLQFFLPITTLFREKGTAWSGTWKQRFVLEKFYFCSEKAPALRTVSGLMWAQVIVREPLILTFWCLFSFQENLAASYLAKVRKLQKDLEDMEDRAETAESALNKARSRARASGGGGGGGIGRQTSREVSRPLSRSNYKYNSYPSALHTLWSPTSNRYSDKYSSYY